MGARSEDNSLHDGMLGVLRRMRFQPPYRWAPSSVIAPEMLTPQTPVAAAAAAAAVASPSLAAAAGVAPPVVTPSAADGAAPESETPPADSGAAALAEPSTSAAALVAASAVLGLSSALTASSGSLRWSSFGTQETALSAAPAGADSGAAAAGVARVRWVVGCWMTLRGTGSPSVVAELPHWSPGGSVERTVDEPDCWRTGWGSGQAAWKMQNRTTGRCPAEERSAARWSWTESSQHTDHPLRSFSLAFSLLLEKMIDQLVHETRKYVFIMISKPMVRVRHAIIGSN